MTPSKVKLKRLYNRALKIYRPCLLNQGVTSIVLLQHKAITSDLKPH